MKQRLLLSLLLGGLVAQGCTGLLGNDFTITSTDASATGGGAGLTATGGSDTDASVGGNATGGGGGNAGSGATDSGTSKEGGPPDTGPACDAMDPTCELCQPNQYQCDGATLQLCGGDQRSWDNIDVCVSGGLCDATSHRCLQPVCQIGDHKCQDADLMRCSDSQDGWTFEQTCTAAAYCDAANARCNAQPCKAGDFQCSGAILEQCNSAQTDWQTVQTCATPALCDSVGQVCQAPACPAGGYRCSANVLQHCNTDRTAWEPAETCATNALCDATGGQCIPPTCNPGDFYCSGAWLQTCNAGQTAFVDFQPCVSAAYCDATAGKCNAAPCTPNQYQCSGPQLQRCNASQTGWDDVGAPCATPALCDYGNQRCITPACQPGDHQCTGTQLQTCNTDQTAYATTQTCTSSALCDAPNGECDICTPDDYTCQGAELHHCAADGQSNPVVDTCGTSAQCNATAGRCDSCPATGRGPNMVQLDTHCIDETEVTNAQYKAFLDTTPPTTGQPNRCGWNTSYTPLGTWPRSGEDNVSVGGVDWCDAYAFCQWSGKRLCGKIGGGPNNVADYADPTLDQWYHACISSPASYFYPYGNSFGSTTCNGDAYDGVLSTTQCKGAAIVVKSATACHSPTSPYSQIYDMSGNEDEWEDSCIQAASGTGAADVCRTRGGSYCDGQSWLNCSANWGYDLTHGWTRNRQLLNVGFRCCAP